MCHQLLVVLYYPCLTGEFKGKKQKSDVLKFTLILFLAHLGVSCCDRVASIIRDALSTFYFVYAVEATFSV